MRPDLALKVARISLLGITRGEMTALHRRIDRADAHQSV
jgi:hypothetical protein